MLNGKSKAVSGLSKTKPVLSLILCSRNDEYMGNSRWRLQTTLNYVAQKVHEQKRDEEVEILVADWGSEIPLLEVLELSPIAEKMVSFILIPPKKAHELQKDSPFPEVLALNAAARRASGEYIGRIDQDTLVGERFLEYFFELFEGRQKLEVPLNSALLFANRRSIPYQFAVACPPLDYVDKFIHLFGSVLKVWRQNRFTHHVFWTSYVGIWLVHRTLWEGCGGYDESLIYYNWMDTDMIMRLSENREVIDLGKKVAFGFYHLEHYNPREHWSARIHALKNSGVDLNDPPKVLNPNGDNWGLAEFPLEVLHSSFVERKNNQVSLDSLGFNWLAFILLLLSSGLGSVEDWLVLLYKSTLGILDVWRHRLEVIRKTTYKQPISKWPKLFFNYWIERKTRLSRGID